MTASHCQIPHDSSISTGVTIRATGIGDGVQFSSLFENYWNRYRKRLVDVSRPWFLDFNPYAERLEQVVENQVELWNYPKIYDLPFVRDSVYLSNAEIHASLFGIENPGLCRPRLYQFEGYSFSKRDKILLHPLGRSHGDLPDSVIQHVIRKYGPTGNLFQIGLPGDLDLGLRRIVTPTLWDLAKEISECRILIGPDSGPAWIGACYPDVIVKKVRTKFQDGYGEPKYWVPLDVKNHHSFWDDQRLFKIYNCTEEDIGFTSSYRNL